MNRFFVKYRTEDDDSAPMDYTCFSSVAEAQKNRQEQAIHRTREDVVVRHHAEPAGGRASIDGYRTRPRQPVDFANEPKQEEPQSPRGYEAMRKPPIYRSADNSQVEQEWQQQHPRSPMGMRVRTVAMPQPQPQPIAPPAQAGQSQAFGAPVAPAIPDWYHGAQREVAQGTGARRHPRVQRAQQPENEQPQSWQAQPAPPPSRQPMGYPMYPGNPPPSPYPPQTPTRRLPPEPQQGELATQPAQEPPRDIPWLGIAVITLCAIAVALWLAGMGITARTQTITAQREQARQAIVDKHPLRYRELIESEAKKNNLHPAFVAAIILNESSFKPDAESRVGARGLMQMMEDTAQWVNGKLDNSADYSFDRMWVAEDNVRFGCWYLSFLSDRFRGDPVLVAAAFHAGQGTVQNWLNDSKYSSDNLTLILDNLADGPTKSYATRVVKDYAVYKRVYYEQSI